MAEHIANIDSTVPYRPSGMLLPPRDIAEWTDDELDLAARRATLRDTGAGEPPRGAYAETDGERRWEVAPKTRECNRNRRVLIQPPWRDEYVECQPVRHMQQWRRNQALKLYAVAGRRDGYPMLAAMRGVATGASDGAYRAVYIGPYCGEQQLLPVSMDD